jgi:hypothetical protein
VPNVGVVDSWLSCTGSDTGSGCPPPPPPGNLPQSSRALQLCLLSSPVTSRIHTTNELFQQHYK